MLNFAALDFETADYGADSACSVGIVRVENGVVVQRVSRLIRPPRREFLFTYIHGLTWNDVAEQPHFGDLWPQLAHLFEGIDFIAAHNASFDRKVLMACCSTYGVQVPAVPFRCTVELSREVWSIRPTRLSNVCEKLGIALNHHEALSDANACAEIVLRAYGEKSGTKTTVGAEKSTSSAPLSL